MRHIQAAYVYAIKAGRIRSNPTVDLSSPKPDVREPRIISGECLRQINLLLLGDRPQLVHDADIELPHPLLVMPSCLPISSSEPLTHNQRVRRLRSVARR